MTDETDLKQPERAQVFLQGESERFMKSLLEASTEPSSEIIYHYSGQEALLGILKSARIFASDLRFMNDHTERRFADRFIEQMIQENEGLGPFLLPLTDQSPVQIEIPEYAACFSQDGDSLAQWRMYAGFNGYAIGWKHSAIAETAMASPTMTHFFPCCYDPEVQRKSLADSIGRIKEFVVAEGLTLEAASYLYSNIVWCARSFYKHPSFAYEREMRLITFEHRNQDREGTDYQFSVRPGRNNLIPYVRVPVPTPAEIIIGPSAHPERAKQALDELIIRSGIKNLPTKISSAPFVEF
ncbi:MAG TPA: hypothetical protein DD397_08690 [Hyphomonas sp.]|uniref:DUF2971 domain-containing protein n=1 Tax=unclassified Hyphomonas TaxID=2630699 RepID=UPI000C56D1DF|nr:MULTISPECIES: DUF2971 domain-containing protein [unclassified Hyphomonas]MAN90026.1 hypothetical protein [Hyphomonadaceae bacterium]MAA80751.1 hypothetical protein [Hyphomonas sp.]MBG66910.1 hypothetical protein [Hyphomonas sp.]HAQ75587.1 hypothetical protein [Hyphomonas sp.]HBN92623.1 hypothetical protein [Hyphomonas sp.]